MKTHFNYNTNKKQGFQLNTNSSKQNKKEYLLKDMINLLEIDQETKKMLHAPTLKVFLLRRLTDSVQRDKKFLY